MYVGKVDVASGAVGGVKPLLCSLQVISAHRGARSWKYKRDPAEGFSRGLYGAVRRHPHPSALSGDLGPLTGMGPPPPVSPQPP